jgi:hypothetical protein
MQDSRLEYKKQIEQIGQDILTLMDSVKDTISDEHQEILDILSSLEKPCIPDLRFALYFIELNCLRILKDFRKVMSIAKNIFGQEQSDPINRLKKTGKFKKVEFESEENLPFYQILDICQPVNIEPSVYGGQPLNSKSNAWILGQTGADEIQLFEFPPDNIAHQNPIPTSVFKQKFKGDFEVGTFRGEIVAASTAGIST